ncbi:MAG: hypothetical protein M1840_001349 [Geoglossum simile]|nr:MAG: hypothetical protein M1840_001349 [Geoglossum simile]
MARGLVNATSVPLETESRTAVQIKLMGAYSSSFASGPPSKASTSPASKAPPDSTPNRTQRAHCWEARDVFFRCLDHNNIIDSITDHDLARKQCGREEVAFGENCASSWVHYFKKRRVMEHKRSETIEKLRAGGAQPLPGGGSAVSRGPPN